jgi:hypothetical protein
MEVGKGLFFLAGRSRQTQQLLRRANPELAQQIAPVRLGGARADRQFFGDLLVGFACQQVVEHLPFASGQRGEAVIEPRRRRRQKPVGLSRESCPSIFSQSSMSCTLCPGKHPDSPHTDNSTAKSLQRGLGSVEARNLRNVGPLGVADPHQRVRCRAGPLRQLGRKAW